MLNFNPNDKNTFVIYADTIDNPVQTFGDYFLFGFQNGFTKEWTYVVPTVLIRNSRYLKFEINIVPSLALDDLLNSDVYLFPSGNWDYKLWNTDLPTLDPASGNLIDKGQMILADEIPAEVAFVPYVSNNETLKSFVYYTANGVWNNTAQLWDYYESEWQNN
jgi:hypothetical protein